MKLVFWVGGAVLGAMAMGPRAADAAWGMQYELGRDGVNWSSGIMFNGGDTIAFRIGVYFDVGTKITTADGTGNAMAVARFTGSTQFTNFVVRDVLQNVVRTASSGGAEVVQTSGGTIGTAGVGSFAGQELTTLPAQPQRYFELLRGQIKTSPSGLVRGLLLKSKTFGSGSIPGLLFYHDGSPVNLQSGVPDGPRIDREADMFVPAAPTTVLLAAALIGVRRRRGSADRACCSAARRFTRRSTGCTRRRRR